MRDVIYREGERGEGQRLHITLIIKSIFFLKEKKKLKGLVTSLMQHLFI
jgi:hypothetical protein